jgi:hypothetical protein
MGRRSTLSALHPVLWVRTQELSADPVPWSDSRSGFKTLRKVQHHRTCNASWPRRKPSKESRWATPSDSTVAGGFRRDRSEKVKVVDFRGAEIFSGAVTGRPEWEGCRPIWRVAVKRRSGHWEGTLTGLLRQHQIALCACFRKDDVLSIRRQAEPEIHRISHRRDL